MSLTNRIKKYLMTVDNLNTITVFEVKDALCMTYTRMYRLLGKEGTTCKALITEEQRRGEKERYAANKRRLKKLTQQVPQE